MTYSYSHKPQIPFNTLVALGEMEGFSSDRKFGAVLGVATAYAVVAIDSILWLPTVASVVRVKAGGNAADTLAGVGAQKITVEGLGDDGLPATAVLNTLGALAGAPSTQTFLRVNRAYVSQMGSDAGEANVAKVVIEIGAGSVDVIAIDVDQGQSESSHISIPVNKAIVGADFHAFVKATQAATSRLIRRGGDGIRRSQQRYFGADVTIDHDSHLSDAARDGGGNILDLWIETKATAGTTDVSSHMSYRLVDFTV
jgi:hypothetical protein